MNESLMYGSEDEHNMVTSMLSSTTDPNACQESDLWFLNGNIENLSRLVEAGISNSDVERIPRYNVV